MPLNAPAPGPRFRRFAEDADEVPAGAADHRTFLLQLGEDALQTHDRHGLIVTLLASAGLEQFQRGLLLIFGKLLERDALAGVLPLLVLLRGEEPAQALRIVEAEGGALFQLGGERIE